MGEKKKSKQLCYLTCDTSFKSQALLLYISINTELSTPFMMWLQTQKCYSRKQELVQRISDFEISKIQS